MPRNGSGFASSPPGTTATPNTTILSSAHNTLKDDIYSLMNTAWPVALGGTGTTDLKFSTATFGLKDSSDATKILAFDLSGITTATTRTKKFVDVDGTLKTMATAAAEASAATVDLGTIKGSLVSITGSTTITSLGDGGPQAGLEVTVVFSGSLTLTHSSTLILPGNANILTTAGDVATFVSGGSPNGWRCTSYLVRTQAPYVTGSFTPTLSGSSTAGSGTYTNRLGTYTKNGNVVSFAIQIDWTAHTGTGNMIITGLPFTNGSRRTAVAVTPVGITFSGSGIVGYVEADAKQINFISPASNAGSSVAIEAAGTVYVAGTYIAA